MRYLIDTNVWIDALSGKLAASANFWTRKKDARKRRKEINP